MAQGDVTVFEEFALSLGTETHNLPNGNDVIKLAIIDNVITPTAADATPAWGASSGVDYDDNEVSSAGSYTAGGETLGTIAFTEAAGVATFDADNVVIAQDGSGFTDGYWGIIYNETATNNEAIAFVEMGGPVSEQAGQITFTWNASGIFTITVS